VKPPRGLSAEESAAWAQVARTVKPISPVRMRKVTPAASLPTVGRSIPEPTQADLAKALGEARAARAARPAPGPAVSTRLTDRSAPPEPAGLDSHWDRRFRAGSIEPDFTLDLHGHTLDQAHDRLDAGLAQARAMGARVVLVIAGKPRPVDAADRGARRGAIRAKLLDWLAAGPHGSSVAAVRAAHRRHGGEGALYLVLKRAR
jgi:DNA-nicking Smr family endonuclease